MSLSSVHTTVPLVPRYCAATTATTTASTATTAVVAVLAYKHPQDAPELAFLMSSPTRPSMFGIQPGVG